MATDQPAGDRGRPLADDWEERQRSNSPTNIVIRGAVGDAAPRGVTLPPNAYAQLSNYSTPYIMPNRPPTYNTTGKEVSMGVNMHQMLLPKGRKVHQYDIIITGGTGTEKRGLLRALWESKTRAQQTGPNWIWNGDKIAWSDTGIAALNSKRVPAEKQSHHFTIDLDEERDNPAVYAAAKAARVQRGEDPQHERNKFTVQIRYTKSINLEAINAYLEGKIVGWDPALLEPISLLNHIIRENPQRNLTCIKNSFFRKNLTNQDKYDLGDAVYALKGAFQSIRMGQNASLMVNVDVSHATFYHSQRVDHAVYQLLQQSGTAQVISLLSKHQRDPPFGVYKDSSGMKKIKTYLKKLAFRVDYKGCPDKVKNRRWIIKDISYDTAQSSTFYHTDTQTGKREQINVHQYFRKFRGVHLEHPQLPLIECTKKGVFYPMEICKLEDGQRYPFKLDEKQTADMIKFAVARPDIRQQSIRQGLSALNWQQDPTLNHYGIRINPNQMKVKARLLDPPRVQFANNKFEDPKFAGRWRIDGKQFIKPNSKPLKTWGVCVVDPGRGNNGYVSDQEAMQWVRGLISAYKGHGGIVANSNPAMCRASENDTAAAVDTVFAKLRAQGLPDTAYPDLIVFILPRKNTENYQRLKRSADLKWGTVSQCVQAAHVKRMSPQYFSNVLMKVNAKLGGQSFKAVPISPKTYFSVPTMIIGGDVSHPSPGSLAPSMAAITVSMDRDAIRYGAAVQSNGHRLEMITTWNWTDMLGPMAREWISSIGGGRYPQHVYYFRDGVSEGQYEHVIQQEVRDIQAVFKTLDPSPDGSNCKNLKFTVVVASKRHHVRFFPADAAGADRNKNCHPGTLVERDITAFKTFDFYLSSHSAIQGTARPTHYHVIMDQANLTANKLQNMIYEHCYQYIRSSTPVSLYPAIYYAHLASRRAVAHERQGHVYTGHKSSEQKERYILLRARAEADMTGKIMTKDALERLKFYTTSEYPPCIPTCNKSLWFGMWYI